MAFVAPGEWDGGLVRVKDMLVRDASGEDGLQIDVPVKALESLPALFAAEAKKQGVSWRPLREPASGSELPGGETAGATPRLAQATHSPLHACTLLTVACAPCAEQVQRRVGRRVRRRRWRIWRSTTWPPS
jgi:hypothetical protein